MHENTTKKISIKNKELYKLLDKLVNGVATGSSYIRNKILHPKYIGSRVAWRYWFGMLDEGFKEQTGIVEAKLTRLCNQHRNHSNNTKQEEQYKLLKQLYIEFMQELIKLSKHKHIVKDGQDAIAIDNFISADILTVRESKIFEKDDTIENILTELENTTIIKPVKGTELQEIKIESANSTEDNPKYEYKLRQDFANEQELLAALIKMQTIKVSPWRKAYAKLNAAAIGFKHKQQQAINYWESIESKSNFVNQELPFRTKKTYILPLDRFINQFITDLNSEHPQCFNLTDNKNKTIAKVVVQHGQINIKAERNLIIESTGDAYTLQGLNIYSEHNVRLRKVARAQNISVLAKNITTSANSKLVSIQTTFLAQEKLYLNGEVNAEEKVESIANTLIDNSKTQAASIIHNANNATINSKLDAFQIGITAIDYEQTENAKLTTTDKSGHNNNKVIITAENAKVSGKTDTAILVAQFQHLILNSAKFNFDKAHFNVSDGLCSDNDTLFRISNYMSLNSKRFTEFLAKIRFVGLTAADNQNKIANAAIIAGGTHCYTNLKINNINSTADATTFIKALEAQLAVDNHAENFSTDTKNIILTGFNNAKNISIKALENITLSGTHLAAESFDLKAKNADLVEAFVHAKNTRVETVNTLSIDNSSTLAAKQVLALVTGHTLNHGVLHGKQIYSDCAGIFANFGVVDADVQNHLTKVFINLFGNLTAREYAAINSYLTTIIGVIRGNNFNINSFLNISLYSLIPTRAPKFADLKLAYSVVQAILTITPYFFPAIGTAVATPVKLTLAASQACAAAWVVITELYRGAPENSEELKNTRHKTMLKWLKRKRNAMPFITLGSIAFSAYTAWNGLDLPRSFIDWVTPNVPTSLSGSCYWLGSMAYNTTTAALAGAVPGMTDNSLISIGGELAPLSGVTKTNLFELSATAALTISKTSIINLSTNAALGPINIMATQVSLLAWQMSILGGVSVTAFTVKIPDTFGQFNYSNLNITAIELTNEDNIILNSHIKVFVLNDNGKTEYIGTYVAYNTHNVKGENILRLCKIDGPEQFIDGRQATVDCEYVSPQETFLADGTSVDLAGIKGHTGDFHASSTGNNAVTVVASDESGHVGQVIGANENTRISFFANDGVRSDLTPEQARDAQLSNQYSNVDFTNLSAKQQKKFTTPEQFTNAPLDFQFDTSSGYTVLSFPEDSEYQDFIIGNPENPGKAVYMPEYIPGFDVMTFDTGDKGRVDIYSLHTDRSIKAIGQNVYTHKGNIHLGPGAYLFLEADELVEMFLTDFEMHNYFVKAGDIRFTGINVNVTGSVIFEAINSIVGDTHIEVAKNTSYGWKWRGLNSGPQKKTTKEEVATPSTFTAGDTVAMSAGDGGIDINGLAVKAGNLIYFRAHNGVNLLGVVTQDKTGKVSVNLFEVATDKVSNEKSTGVILESPQIYIESETGRILITDPKIDTGALYLKFANDQTSQIGNNILNHTGSGKSLYARLSSLFGIPVTDSPKELFNNTGIGNSIEQMKNGSYLDKVLGFFNFFGSAKDIINQDTNAIFGVRPGQVGVDLGYTEYNYNYQTIYDGYINAGFINIEGGHFNITNGLTIRYDKAIFAVDSISATAAKLNFHFESHNTNLNITANFLTNQIDGFAPSMSGTEQDGVNYILCDIKGNQTTLKGTDTIYLEGTWDIGKGEGFDKADITLQDLQNVFESNGYILGFGVSRFDSVSATAGAPHELIRETQGSSITGTGLPNKITHNHPTLEDCNTKEQNTYSASFTKLDEGVGVLDIGINGKHYGIPIVTSIDAGKNFLNKYLPQKAEPVNPTEDVPAAAALPVPEADEPVAIDAPPQPEVAVPEMGDMCFIGDEVPATPELDNNLQEQPSVADSTPSSADIMPEEHKDKTKREKMIEGFLEVGFHRALNTYSFLKGIRDGLNEVKDTIVTTAMFIGSEAGHIFKGEKTTTQDVAENMSGFILQDWSRFKDGEKTIFEELFIDPTVDFYNFANENPKKAFIEPLDKFINFCKANPNEVLYFASKEITYNVALGGALGGAVKLPKSVIPKKVVKPMNSKSPKLPKVIEVSPKTSTKPVKASVRPKGDTLHIDFVSPKQSVIKDLKPIFENLAIKNNFPKVKITAWEPTPKLQELINRLHPNSPKTFASNLERQVVPLPKNLKPESLGISNKLFNNLINDKRIAFQAKIGELTTNVTLKIKGNTLQAGIFLNTAKTTQELTMFNRQMYNLAKTLDRKFVVYEVWSPSKKIKELTRNFGFKRSTMVLKKGGQSSKFKVLTSKKHSTDVVPFHTKKLKPINTQVKKLPSKVKPLKELGLTKKQSLAVLKGREVIWKNPNSTTANYQHFSYKISGNTFVAKIIDMKNIGTPGAVRSFFADAQKTAKALRLNELKVVISDTNSRLSHVFKTRYGFTSVSNSFHNLSGIKVPVITNTFKLKNKTKISFGAPSLAITETTYNYSKKLLSQIGLQRKQISDFYRNKLVKFDIKTSSTEIEALIKLDNNKLVFGIYFIKNNAHNGAINDFFKEGIKLAKALNIDKIEVIGISIVNTKLKNIMKKRYKMKPGTSIIIREKGLRPEVRETLGRTYDLKTEKPGMAFFGVSDVPKAARRSLLGPSAPFAQGKQGGYVNLFRDAKPSTMSHSYDRHKNSKNSSTKLTRKLYSKDDRKERWNKDINKPSFEQSFFGSQYVFNQKLKARNFLSAEQKAFSKMKYLLCGADKAKDWKQVLNDTKKSYTPYQDLDHVGKLLINHYQAELKREPLLLELAPREDLRFRLKEADLKIKKLKEK